MTTAGLDFRMDFYTKDFLASTLAMTGPERGAFAVALVVAWTQGASLPAEPERIARMCGYAPEEWARVWPALEPKFPATRDGASRRNPRQVALWNEGKARVQKAHEKGKAMAGARWPKGHPPDAAPAPAASKAVSNPVSNADSIATASPQQCPSPSPSPSPSSSSSSAPSSTTTKKGTASSSERTKGEETTKPEALSVWKITLDTGTVWPVPAPVVEPYRRDLERLNEEMRAIERRTKADPSLRPSAANARRFITGCLERAVRRQNEAYEADADKADADTAREAESARLLAESDERIKQGKARV